MATLTEMMAAVVVHSSTVAFSHFGVTLEPARVEHPTPVSERVIARSPRRNGVLADAPEGRKAQVKPAPLKA